MKLKQILEETDYHNILEDDRGKFVGMQSGTNYYVDGCKVSEEYFRRQRKRICLWTKKVRSSSEGPVFMSGYYSLKSKKIIQYFPLPF